MLRLAPRGAVACVDEPLVLQRFSPNSITRGLARRRRPRPASRSTGRSRPPPGAARPCSLAVAGGHAPLGNLADARAALARARALRPLDPRLWAMTLRLMLRRDAPFPPRPGAL